MSAYLPTIAILLAIFCVAVDAPSWGGPHMAWAWKGIAAAAAYYKGLHTDKPKDIGP